MPVKIKLLLLALGILFLAFIVVQVFALNSQRNIEMYPYTLIKKGSTFEIRAYEASLFTSVTISNDTYKKSSKKGFSMLAGYIFGNNETNEKIAMTSPVSMSLSDSTTMMFMVPRKLQKEKLPKPLEQQIKFIEEPAKTVAAIRFTGWANDDKITKYKQELCKALDVAKIPYSNKFYFLGYNAPYEFFNRKNEIIVELPKSYLK
ncbi:heme-binding protein [Tenacibaculum sp. SG-28]|uniref:SOUL family heme-binding protein n=1 Tax=Tenacibaculum sp. SG-28 TaxID=754426 RepID=UPI001E2AE209|nr:heme-binding protein [Tenacibaculum sp. SG-28]